MPDVTKSILNGGNNPWLILLLSSFQPMFHLLGLLMDLSWSPIAAVAADIFEESLSVTNPRFYQVQVTVRGSPKPDSTLQQLDRQSRDPI